MKRPQLIGGQSAYHRSFIAWPPKTGGNSQIASLELQSVPLHDTRRTRACTPPRLRAVCLVLAIGDYSQHVEQVRSY